jgi:hypothetical protein
LVYLSSKKKHYCSNEHTITPCNVNSGETSIRKKDIEIRLFRTEDFYKVLIHELLHACLWDRLVEPVGSEKSMSMPNEQEAFVEANARYLYCCLLAKWYPDKTFDQYWELEQKWMLTQAMFLRQSRWKTDTNTIAYYLFTLALLSTPQNEFFTWVYRKNGQTDKQMHEQWITQHRHTWWNALYKKQSYWLPKSETDSCQSMRMVRTQMPLT